MANGTNQGSQPRELGATANGVGQGGSPVLEVFERPSEAHTRAPILKTNPATGMTFWDMPLRRPMEEIGLGRRSRVEGLRVFRGGNGITILYEFDSPEPIDEAIAADAQSRAGWSDYAYGFYGFKTVKLPWGAYVATWKSSASNAD